MIYHHSSALSIRLLIHECGQHNHCDKAQINLSLQTYMLEAFAGEVVKELVGRAFLKKNKVEEIIILMQKKGLVLVHD